MNCPHHCEFTFQGHLATQGSYQKRYCPNFGTVEPLTLKLNGFDNDYEPKWKELHGTYTGFVASGKFRWEYAHIFL